MSMRLRHVTPDRYDAVLFDLDGVLTDTARIHAAAWRQVFDPLLERISARRGEPFRPFDPERDYREYVDGRSRLDGARGFLASRGIPPTEAGGLERIARCKDALYSRTLAECGVEPFGGALRWLRALRAAGLRTAVVSASHHCLEVLRAARIEELFDTRVDGVVADEVGLRGKPEPDLFLEAARRLGVSAARSAVVEDAISGVRAARSGCFGLVVAVARSGTEQLLREAGADLVVRDLGEMLT